MKRTRSYIIAVHFIGWLIFLSLPAVFVSGLMDIVNLPALFNPLSWKEFIIYPIIFYLHTYLLFPKFYFSKKYILYFLSILLFAIAVFYLRPFDNLVHRDGMHSSPVALKARSSAQVSNLQVPAKIKGQELKDYRPDKEREHWDHGPKMDFVSIILFILVIAVSVTLVIIKRWQIAVEQSAKAEADKVNAELSFLKAQVDPHFLFNTLNNIYSLAVTKDENTAESIMKLSNIMRYITDEAKENFVSLRNETNFITDYIELQRLRLGSKVTLDFTVSGNLRDKVIAPLILITFIENVFKYGISNNEPSTISIDLKADNNSISFSCRNKLFPLKHQVEGTGIGIRNTKTRLEHLYPGKYSLNIKEDGGSYSVLLILQA